MRISDWSSDVCSSDLGALPAVARTCPLALRRQGAEYAFDSGSPIGGDARRLRYDGHGRPDGRERSLRRLQRSEARREGKGCVSPCSSRWSRYPSKKQKKVISRVIIKKKVKSRT